MKILSIETSCDETACSVVEDGRNVLANVIASQIDIHAKTGGVVPEVAAREHVLKMLPVLQECLEQSESTWEDIDALAVTKGPGLISSLIIGTETASVISYVKDIPLIPVQHIAGHIYSNWLEREEEIVFPILILTVSGGHNELYLMKSHYDFEVLGETRDDAAGEAFDKVARLMGLSYPGGPAIAKIAELGDASAFDLPRAWLEKESLDFSFSGLKTAVLDRVKKHKNIDDKFKADMAASFQESVVEVLSGKLMRALAKYPDVKEIHLAGGVSANLRLREVIEHSKPSDVAFKYPKKLTYCTDNAAMIGAAAYFQIQKDPEVLKSKNNIIPSSSFVL
jgi:N6-L-threonylcarbamoyladenine synthase